MTDLDHDHDKPDRDLVQIKCATPFGEINAVGWHDFAHHMIEFLETEGTDKDAVRRRRIGAAGLCAMGQICDQLHGSDEVPTEVVIEVLPVPTAASSVLDALSTALAGAFIDALNRKDH